MSHQNYFAYILTNDDRHTVLYLGVTNELGRRANECSLGRGSFFAQQYNAYKPIYFEAYSDPESAIAREKQLENRSRQKKKSLTGKSNPERCNLVDEMYALAPTGGVR